MVYAKMALELDFGQSSIVVSLFDMDFCRYLHLELDHFQIHRVL